MSMDHKAYVFDYHAFKSELSGTLMDALSTGQTDSLVKFIEGNRESLTYPYGTMPDQQTWRDLIEPGDHLDESWQDLVETPDAHTYGDFALTKFYDPADDIGLSHGWDEAETLLERELGHDYYVLGTPFGPP